jgi:hypothetical protein
LWTNSFNSGTLNGHKDALESSYARRPNNAVRLRPRRDCSASVRPPFCLGQEAPSCRECRGKEETRFSQFLRGGRWQRCRIDSRRGPSTPSGTDWFSDSLRSIILETYRTESIPAATGHQCCHTLRPFRGCAARLGGRRSRHDPGHHQWGASWHAQTSGTRADLRSVYFADAQRGLVVGDQGTILATTDGGASWHPQTSSTQADLWSVYFSDAQRGWAVGAQGLHPRQLALTQFILGGLTYLSAVPAYLSLRRSFD